VILSSAVLPDGIVLPKVERASDVQWLDESIERLVGERGKDVLIVGQMESARSLLNLNEICQASPRLKV
jgi:citrate lyase beta subunit